MRVKTKAGVSLMAFQVQTGRESVGVGSPFGPASEEEKAFMEIQGRIRCMVGVFHFDRPDEGWIITYQGDNGEVVLKGGDVIVIDEHGGFHPIKKNLFELLFDKEK